MKYLYFYLREYFFPSGCGGCGKTLFEKEDAYYGLCVCCRDFMSYSILKVSRCITCNKPLISEKDRCLSCRQSEGAFNGQIAKLKVLFPYTGKFKAVLGAFKFEKSLGVGNFLTDCLNQALEGFSEGELESAFWVPVPPRPGKIKRQGWDQVEFLARKLKKINRLPLHRCLKRLPSRSQKVLNRKEREENLKGRIVCVKQPPRTAILFDDVITTGATLNACAAALLEGGAAKVYGICLFYD